MLKIGHRGAAGLEPENTLRSFRRAFALGADGIEFDIQLCKSGEPVVIHDTTLERTTNGSGHVQDKTLAELKMLDAGKGEIIPTLAEVLGEFGHQGWVFIELKAAECVLPVGNVISDYLAQGGGAEKLAVISFDHHALAHIKQRVPALYTGANLVAKPLDYAAMAEGGGLWSINPCHEFLDTAFVADAHRRNLQCFTWTCNRPEDIARAKALGVDGIFSDFPDRL